MMEPGQVFDGRFKLIKRIGFGGFSEVWLVNDQMALDNAFALKIYKPKESLDKSAIQQFRQEFLKLVNLGHQNIIRVYNYSIYKGMPYLVLPYFEQGNLGSLLKHRHMITPDFIKNLGTQIAVGLEYLHSQQVVHRDIKPDNILVSGSGKYVISDLGISDSLRQTIVASEANYSNAVSLPYASPEMLDNNFVNQKTDIFSFGVLLYEAINNDLPWNGIGGAGVKQTHWKLSLPENFKSFEEIINVCVHPDISKRPSANELITMLNNEKLIVNNRGIHKLVKGIIFGVMLLLLVGIGIFYLFPFKEEPPVINCQQFDAHATEFTQGIAWARKNKYYGFINKNCDVVIGLKYDHAFAFSENYAAVSWNGQWGFIDMSGDWIIAPDYDKVQSFVDGKATVWKDGNYFQIDTRGNIIK